MIDPQDIDPDTGMPYPGYSSPSIDTTLHDIEMDVDDREEREHARLVVLDEIADGAYGDGPRTRGLARDLAARIRRRQEADDEG